MEHKEINTRFKQLLSESEQLPNNNWKVPEHLWDIISYMHLIGFDIYPRIYGPDGKLTGTYKRNAGYEMRLAVSDPLLQ